MRTFVYHLAERVTGQQEMERFARPIHVGIVTAEDVLAAYAIVVEDLRPTFADHPQLLDARFEQMSPPHDGGGEAAGIWKHHHPLDMEITFSDAD
jgi:hypothetical protein